MRSIIQLTALALFGGTLAACAAVDAQGDSSEWALDEVVWVDDGIDCPMTMTTQMNDLALAIDQSRDFEILEILDEGMVELSGSQLSSASLLGTSAVAPGKIRYHITCEATCEALGDEECNLLPGSCVPVFPKDDEDNRAPWCNSVQCDDPNDCLGSCTQTVTATTPWTNTH